MPPALIVRLSLLTNSNRARAIQRYLPDMAGRESVRERAAALIATGGIGAKVAVTALISAAVVAGGIGASHVMIDHHTAHRRATSGASAPVRLPQSTQSEHQTLLFSQTDTPVGLVDLVAAVVIDGLDVDLGESEEDLAEQLFAQ